MESFSAEFAKRIAAGEADSMLKRFFQRGQVEQFTATANSTNLQRQIDSPSNIVLSILFATADGTRFLFDCNSNSWFSLTAESRLCPVPYPSAQAFSIAALYKRSYGDINPQIAEYAQESVLPPSPINRQITWNLTPNNSDPNSDTESPPPNA